VETLQVGHGSKRSLLLRTGRKGDLTLRGVFAVQAGRKTKNKELLFVVGISCVKGYGRPDSERGRAESVLLREGVGERYDLGDKNCRQGQAQRDLPTQVNGT